MARHFVAPRLAMVAIGAGLLGLAGCATQVTPRAFAPVLERQPENIGAFAADFQACFDHVAGAAALPAIGANPTGAVARGAGQAAAEQATTNAIVTGVGGQAAGLGGFAAAGLVLAPLEGLEMAAREQHRQEVLIQNAMGQCLREKGHQVVQWRAIKPKELAAAPYATPTKR